MLKIRDFAKLADVSMTALRYYDEIGLLKPVHVDPVTSYRFYNVDQLPQLHRILAFKELGLTLAQIVEIMGEGVAPEVLHGMLRVRQAQLHQQIQLEQEQLIRIEARLQSLERSNSMPGYHVVLKAVKPITGVSLHLTSSDLAYQGHWQDAADAMLASYGVHPVDHLLLLHAEHEDEYSLRAVDIVAPVDPRDITTLLAQSEGRLKRCELPAVPHMASILYHGYPALMLPAYQSLGTWIERNAYTIAGPRRKVFLRRGEQLDDALTEIQFPVEKAA